MELSKVLWQFTILTATEPNTNLTPNSAISKLLMWKVVFLIQKMNLFLPLYSIRLLCELSVLLVNSFVKDLIFVSHLNITACNISNKYFY